MNVLLVYPGFPETFWSFRHALKFISVKATFPPLNLLTIAGLLPTDWSKKIVDLNVEPLLEAHLEWADLVMLGAMQIQAESAVEIVQRCKAQGVKVAAGGVYYTASYYAGTESFDGIDYLFIGETEETLPHFCADWAAGQAQPVYRAESFPELGESPGPAWELIDFAQYNVMPVQFSRGCPFDCEFCHVIILNGRRPRHKGSKQLLRELEDLYQAGWRGTVMVVDDNIICHRGKAKEFFHELITWQQERGYPFIFSGQASVNLADYPDIMELMIKARFARIFLGIETPAGASLTECNKAQNQDRNLVDSIRAIQRQGMEVVGGFIVGFDSDPPTIFTDQVKFIEEAAIPIAMVGMLAAPPGTRLYDRLAAEGRILGESDGDSTMNLKGCNIIPKMGRERLIAGYRQLLGQIYAPRAYYARVLRLLGYLGNGVPVPGKLPSGQEIFTFLKIAWELGVKQPGRGSFWNLLAQALRRYPQFLVLAISLSAEGHHIRSMAKNFASKVDN